MVLRSWYLASDPPPELLSGKKKQSRAGCNALLHFGKFLHQKRVFAGREFIFGVGRQLDADKNAVFQIGKSLLSREVLIELQNKFFAILKVGEHDQLALIGKSC